MTFFRSQRRRRSALLFIGLFVLAVLTQLGIGWYQRRATTQANLWEAADKIRRELRYSTRWNLVRFRQADFDIGSYYVVDKSGLIIDIEGFVADLDFQADTTDLEPGVQTLTVPLTGETWRLLVAPLKGGEVILGVSPPEDITRVDERLEVNAKHFGRSLEGAVRISPSDIDRNLDYTVLDDAGHIRFAIGGIPLKLLHYPRSPVGKIEEIRTETSVTYDLLSVPFVDASGQTVGTVTALEELSLNPWLSFRSWLAHLSSSLVLAFVGTLIGARYMRDEFRPDNLLREALQRGESSTVEFKEALRWDRWQDKQNQADDPRKVAQTKAIAEMVTVKTVAGFLNSRLGGTLFIGIADDKKIVGVERDYESLVKPGEDRGGQDKDRDRLQLHLRNLLAAKIGHEISNLCVETAILSRDGKDVCVVGVSPSPTAVYVPDVKGKAFCLRVGASTVGLDVEEAVAYCQERWSKPLWARLRRWIRTARA
jgi:hypothetical protein